MTNHTISANTLFHFTKSSNNIRNILKNSFTPRYCLEQIPVSEKMTLDMAVPMVCFCDIPLSQIKDHLDTYGEYAIGMSKEWAMTYGISPVLYYYRDSIVSKIVDGLLNFTSSQAKSHNDNKLMEYEPFKDSMKLLFFCKSYKGSMWRDGNLIENRLFYNEREWRFLPNLNDLEEMEIPFALFKDNLDDERLMNECNDRISGIKLGFSPKDIKYIIISKESERLQMVHMIEDIKGGDFTMSDLKELTSKIISVEQVREDF